MTTDVRALSLEPSWALPGARVTVRGASFDVRGPQLPAVTVGQREARVVMASTTRLTFLVPVDDAVGVQRVRVAGHDGEAELVVGRTIATEVHQVDSPVIDSDGSVFLTNSGARGHRVPVSVFRVPPGGAREDYLSDIVNATSLVFDPLGLLHVSSRHDGAVYRVMGDRRVETVATDLGVACGLAFGRDGTLFVGDRGGTVFRVSPTGRVLPFATLPPSVAAYHLAVGPDDQLFATAPTLATCDPVYVIDRTGVAREFAGGFGRPQGLAVDDHGDVYVVEALAGIAALYRLRAGGPRRLVLTAPALVGVALDPRGGLVVSSNDTAYRLDVPIRPFPVFHA